MKKNTDIGTGNDGVFLFWKIHSAQFIQANRLYSCKYMKFFDYENDTAEQY